MAITYSMDNADLDKDASELFGVEFGDDHSADPMRDSYSYHLIRSSKSCVVVSLHNHPSLSKISLVDVRFFLENETIKLLTVVTNLGNIFYLVKGKEYNKSIAIELFNEAVTQNNNATDLKAFQKASVHFLRNCHKAGIIYEDR